MAAKTSRIEGFHNLPLTDRLAKLKEVGALTEEDLKIFQESLKPEVADKIVENVIGVFPVPLGLGMNFLINGKEYLVPMATEEPSVIAAASHAAKIFRENGGITASADEPIMIGQIQVVNPKKGAKEAVLKAKSELIERANGFAGPLVKYGGGVKGLEVRELKTLEGPMLVVHLFVDCRDAMGANTVNTVAEALAPTIEKLTGGKVFLRILSNLAEKRLARAEVRIKKDCLGEETIQGIRMAYAFAEADPYRCATHNKGVMNGITAVALATGNDTRAAEAGAHTFAAKNGYKPLTSWTIEKNGDLIGKIELPITAGTVGGTIKTHPLAQLNLKILGVTSAKELAQVMAAVGLAQNFAALKALATEGIQKGHMGLHAKTVAVAAGAKGEEIKKLAALLVENKDFSTETAEKLLKNLRNKKK